MKRASITEAKNNLSALIDGLSSGSPVLIVDRGRPVARLDPMDDGQKADSDGRLGRLLREGLVRPRRTEIVPAAFNPPAPRAPGGVSASVALIEERRSTR